MKITLNLRNELSYEFYLKSFAMEPINFPHQIRFVYICIFF